LESPFLIYTIIIAVYSENGLRFQQSKTSHLSRIWLWVSVWYGLILSWDWNANRWRDAQVTVWVQ